MPARERKKKKAKPDETARPEPEPGETVAEPVPPQARMIPAIPVQTPTGIVWTPVQMSPPQEPADTGKSWKKNFLIIVAIMVVALAVYIPFMFWAMDKLRQVSWRYHAQYQTLLRDMGEDGVNIFKKFDIDEDNYLSMSEFEPLLPFLDPDLASLLNSLQEKSFPEEIDPAGEMTFVKADFQPLIIETMNTVSQSSMSFLKSKQSVDGLFSWKKVVREVQPIGALQLAAFLPDGILPVGEVYTLVESDNELKRVLSSNRYYPPKARGRRVIIKQLLSMFHSNLFVYSRFPPQGSLAVIRAENEDFVDIVFRIHAEFQLNAPPKHPFWFTPAQFTGHLVISKDASHLEEFHLYVPNNVTLNVDMEWLNAPRESESMMVDIGYLPQMELTSLGPSTPVMVNATNGTLIDQRNTSELYQAPAKADIQWKTEITTQEAFKLMELKMYPFKEVSYLPLVDACMKAKSENKLVHSILLWGALDDQSC